MRDLLTGTVTFLFTDMEGSTRLLERLGERAVPGRPAPPQLHHPRGHRRGRLEVGRAQVDKALANPRKSKRTV